MRPVRDYFKGAEHSGSIWTLFALILFSAGSAYGDAVSDLRGVSVFKDADLNRLANGEILAQRGPQLGLSRGIVIESAFVVHAPVPQAAPYDHRISKLPWLPIEIKQLYQKEIKRLYLTLICVASDFCR